MTYQQYNVFLPELQKYLSIHKSQIIQYFSAPHITKRHYVLNNGEKSDEIHHTSNHIDLVKNLVKKRNAPENKKIEIIELLDSIRETSVLEVSLIKTLTFFQLGDKSINQLEQAIIDNKSIVDTFNRNVKKINSLLLEVFTPEESIATVTESHIRNGYYNSKIDVKEFKRPISDFFIPEYSLTASNKSNTKQVLKLIPDILQNCLTIEEYEAKTDNSYVVYCRSNSRDNEGFLNKNNYYAAFNQAESFPDVAKARRACAARGVYDYEIFPVSAKLGDSLYQTQNFVRGDTITKILTIQEKQLMQAVMHSNYVKELEEKIKNYEQLLIDNNLLEVKVEKPRKVNKL